MTFEEAGKRIIEGASAGMYEAGTIIMANSQILVPVDTGTLKRSGEVTMPELSDDGDSLSSIVGYAYGNEINPESGEPVTGYAKWVEVREFTRTGKKVRHKPPTQAHFLRDAARAVEPEYEGIIEANIKMRMGG